jgi:hypothetical protein
VWLICEDDVVAGGADLDGAVAHEVLLAVVVELSYRSATTDPLRRQAITPPITGAPSSATGSSPALATPTAPGSDEAPLGLDRSSVYQVSHGLRSEVHHGAPVLSPDCRAAALTSIFATMLHRSHAFESGDGLSDPVVVIVVADPRRSGCQEQCPRLPASHARNHARTAAERLRLDPIDLVDRNHHRLDHRDQPAPTTTPNNHHPQ